MSNYCNITNQDNEEKPCRPSFSRKMERSLKKVKRSIQKITENMQDEEKQAIYISPAQLSSLTNNTGFSKREIQKLYRAFKQHCPRGAVTFHDLRCVYAKLFPLGDSSKYMRIVFNTFDKDKDGILTFSDILTGMSTIIKGSIDEKLSWIFRFYDLNNDGCITRNEMIVIISAIYEMVQEGAAIWTTIEKHVERFFQKMDINQDGIISRDEFIISCKNDVIIQNQLIDFNNLLW